MSELVAIINDPGAKIFKERLEQNWYTAETLPILTIEQMYPESVLDTNRPKTLENMRILTAKIKRVEDSIADTYFQLSNPSSRKSHTMFLAYEGQNAHNKWRDNCENKNEIQEIPSIAWSLHHIAAKRYATA